MANFAELWKTLEFREKMKAVTKENWKDPIYREKVVSGISRKWKTKTISAEERARISERSKRIANDPALVAKRVAKFKATCQTEEHKEKAKAAAEKTRNLWAQKEYRSRITEAVKRSWTGTRRKEVGEKAKLRFKDGSFAKRCWRARIRNRLLKDVSNFADDDPMCLENPTFSTDVRCAFTRHIAAIVGELEDVTFFSAIQKLNLSQIDGNADLVAAYARFLCPLSSTLIQTCTQKNVTRVRDGRATSHAVTRSRLETKFQKELEAMSGITAEYIPEIGDIVFKSKRVAIDIDGDLYHAVSNWHSSAMVPVTRDYHRYKVLQSRKRGFRPIRFWGHEIETRRAQCANFVLGALNCGRTIGARACDVVEIDKETTKKLVDAWHIQPYNVSTHHIAFALKEKSNGIPVAVMSFSRHHRQPNSSSSVKEIVLSRLAFAPLTNVHGGSERLLAHAKKKLTEFSRILSWSHERLSNGQVYARLGFTKKAFVGPDYHYVGSYSSTIIPKQQAKKYLLRKRLDSISAPYNPSDSEEQLAAKLKLSRCYDAGKIVWWLSLH